MPDAAKGLNTHAPDVSSCAPSQQKQRDAVTCNSATEFEGCYHMLTVHANLSHALAQSVLKQVQD